MADRTKWALAAALKQSLNQTTLDKITVTNLAETCRINRQTFYYHFQDIYALGEWMFAQEIRQVLGKETDDPNGQENLLKILQYCEANKTMIQNVYHSLDREQLEKWLYQAVFPIFVRLIEKQSADCKWSEEMQAFYASFYSYALSGWILNWVKTGMRADPAIAVARIYALFDASPDGKNHTIC